MSCSPRPAVAVLLGTVAAASVWTASTALAATRGVEVRDRAYAPAAVEIAVGDTVRWSWVGEEPHSVTSLAFDSHPNCSQLTPDECGRAGATFSWTASEPGSVEYRCRIHPDEMQGTVTVTDANAPEPTSPPPPPASSPSPSPSPADRPSPAPERPSPTPSPRPTATAQPAPDDDPEPASSPSPRRTRRAAPSLGVGEASEVPGSPGPTEDHAAPLVSDESPEPLEPFPAPPSPSPSPDPVADDVVAIGAPAGSGREAVRLAGAAALAVTVLVFGRVVLFGRPWT